MTAISKRNGKNRSPSSNAVLEGTSFLSGSNAGFIEGLYEQYLANRDSVDGTWRAFFQALQDGKPIELPAAARRSAHPAPAQSPVAQSNANPQESIRALHLLRASR